MITGEDCENAIETHRRLNGCDAEHILREVFGKLLQERDEALRKYEVARAMLINRPFQDKDVDIVFMTEAQVDENIENRLKQSGV